MMMVGVAFKLSAVPFHFWAPDVFEGATAEVAAFPLGRLESRRIGTAGPPGHWPFPSSPIRSCCKALPRFGNTSVLLIAVLAAVTCTFGNLAAYGQTNMKRLLAYSTIAHAGYMMMPIAAAVVLIENNPRRRARRRQRHWSSISASTCS